MPEISSTSGFSMRSRNCRAYAESDSTYRRCPSAYTVSNASEDFPDPLTPVTTVSALCGISTLTFLRLCTRAPRMRNTSCCSRMGGMVSFVAKGKPRQRAFRTLPKLQSIRLQWDPSKSGLKVLKGKNRDGLLLLQPDASDSAVDRKMNRRRRFSIRLIHILPVFFLQTVRVNRTQPSVDNRHHAHIPGQTDRRFAHPVLYVRLQILRARAGQIHVRLPSAYVQLQSCQVHLGETKNTAACSNINLQIERDRIVHLQIPGVVGIGHQRPAAVLVNAQFSGAVVN